MGLRIQGCGEDTVRETPNVFASSRTLNMPVKYILVPFLTEDRLGVRKMPYRFVNSRTFDVTTVSSPEIQGILPVELFLELIPDFGESDGDWGFREVVKVQFANWRTGYAVREMPNVFASSRTLKCAC